MLGRGSTQWLKSSTCEFNFFLVCYAGKDMVAYDKVRELKQDKIQAKRKIKSCSLCLT